MKITTRQQMEIEVEEKDLITFPVGVVGFEECKRYALTSLPEEDPFVRLQSIESPDTAFVLVNPLLFSPDYDFEVNDDIIELVGIVDPEDLQLFVIVTVHTEYTKMTGNLLAPILINGRNRKACQLILQGTDYSTRHRIFDDSEDEGKEADNG